MAKSKQLYEENGVEISKTTISVGDEVILSYKGLLAKSGADAIYAHIGYGDGWENKEFIPMEKNNDAFKVKINVNHPDKLNIAFKDSVDNWDNNSYQNYSFDVSEHAKKIANAAAKIKSNVKKADTEKSADSKTKATKTKSTAAKTSAKSADKTSASKSTASKAKTEKAPTAKKSSSSKSSSTKKTSK